MNTIYNISWIFMGDVLLVTGKSCVFLSKVLSRNFQMEKLKIWVSANWLKQVNWKQQKLMNNNQLNQATDKPPMRSQKYKKLNFKLLWTIYICNKTVKTSVFTKIIRSRDLLAVPRSLMWRGLKIWHGRRSFWNRIAVIPNTPIQTTIEWKELVILTHGHVI